MQILNVSPEWTFEEYDKAGFLVATLEDAEGTLNLSKSEFISTPSNLTEKSKSNRYPRREV